MIPEAAGAGLGGVLGQIGDVLSKPRRFLWNDVLGLPEDGSELVSNLTGLDKEGVWAKALGMGAEMLGDPLTYAGGLLGRTAKQFAAPLAATESATAKRAALQLAEHPEWRGYYNAMHGDQPAGMIGFGDLYTHGAEAAAAERMFPGVVQPGQSVARIRGIELDPALRGKGLGQQLYLEGMKRHGADWYYNSQASPEAARALQAMADKGLAHVLWDSTPRHGQSGGLHLVRPVPRSAAVSGITETPVAVASVAAPRITNQQAMERFFSTPRMSADDLANSLRTDRVTGAAASSRRPQMANIQAMNETESLLRPSAAEAGRAAREPFLRAIRERPQDALLQHIYADWLDETGHGLESAFVRRLAEQNGAFSGWLEMPGSSPFGSR